MNTLKIVAIGDGAVGKTSMLLSYSTNAFPNEYTPTVFDNYAVNVLVNGTTYNLSLWDTAGQEDYDRIRPLSYPQTDAFIVCYSIISQNSFNNIKNKWLPELSQYAPYVPKILVGLKNDMRNDSNIKSFVDVTQAEIFAKEHDFSGHYLCSALTQDGVKAVFDEAINISINKQNKKKNTSNGCCSIM